MQGTKPHLPAHLKLPSLSHDFMTVHAPMAPSLSVIQEPHLTKYPLWELISMEVIHLMGPAAQPIRKCKPGTISHKNEFIDLNCQTEEAAQFVKQFAFIILGSLRKYFPTFKEIRVKRNAFKKPH